MRKIDLTKGQVALVDDDDYERVAAFKWYAEWNHNTQSYYASRSIGRKIGEFRGSMRMHRFIVGATVSAQHVDHLNHDTLDNRRNNLRLGTASDNALNRRGLSSSNTSGYVGVWWHSQRGFWCADARRNGVRRTKAGFATAAEAAEARLLLWGADND